MGYFTAHTAPAPSDRRSEARTRIECPAQLQLTIGAHVGTLWDLSATGARFHTAKPPSAGMTALLKWHSNEAFCKVVWSTGDMCGLAFDRPLAAGLVDGTVEEEAKRSGPIAAVTNIPLGRKRARL